VLTKIENLTGSSCNLRTANFAKGLYMVRVSIGRYSVIKKIAIH
jgi:hypothetical protein